MSVSTTDWLTQLVPLYTKDCPLLGVVKTVSVNAVNVVKCGLVCPVCVLNIVKSNLSVSSISSLKNDPSFYPINKLLVASVYVTPVTNVLVSAVNDETSTGNVPPER